MATVHFNEARDCVTEQVTASGATPGSESIPLDAAAGRVLAEGVAADRDYPPVARSIRDGFAARAADLPGRLRIAGEVRAGERFAGEVAPGEALEIMTGAPVPPGADTVVMIEHVRRDGDSIEAPAAEPGQFINPQGAEARQGECILGAGQPIGFAEIAWLATVGRSSVRVFRQPSVAIVPTGDEIVEISESPLPHQVRNSNAQSLAAQVRRAGGVPRIFPIARDSREATRQALGQAAACDLLLISGGVSAGKYDVVERALEDLGAEFYFDRVLIQPGQPLVFGRVEKTFFFGLPGNPASTMVTFELFGRAALDLLGGRRETALPLLAARLTTDFRHKPGLTRFLPARLSPDGAELTPVRWRGSSDVPSLVRANALLVAEADRECWKAGDLMRVLLK